MKIKIDQPCRGMTKAQEVVSNKPPARMMAETS
jgi:hypothetical protein